MKFIVEGTMLLRSRLPGSSRDRSMRRVMVGSVPNHFVKEITATSASRAKEICYNRIGSDHALGRSQIKITKVSEMKG